jgi:hypothetical protein
MIKLILLMALIAYEIPNQGQTDKTTDFKPASPAGQISNGLLSVSFYLPDAENGFYRGTRFDWSGIIYSLRYMGEEYYGSWVYPH